MKIRLERVNFRPGGFTTVGYWKWTLPHNKGTLIIQVHKLPWRFELAVWGHELVEVFYCWLFGITTEEADKFDSFYEQEYEVGRIPKTAEPGCDARCPYHWGHMAGIVWERICIYGTFASWKKYEIECNRVMGIEPDPAVVLEEKT
jgi:hypothetical protein